MKISTKPLTPASLKLFLFYAEDACNWDGNPWLNGNRDFTKEDRGNLTQLKRTGLLLTFKDDELGEYIQFTDAGKAFALTHGIKI
jgi:hypothetical protein